MKTLIIILLLSFFTILSGQQKVGSIEFKNTNPSYRYGNRSQAELDSFYYDLSPISRSTSEKHIRFKYENQIIDLFLNTNNEYEGLLLNKIKRCMSRKDSIGNYVDYFDRYFYQKIYLNKSKVEKVFDEILVSKHLEIPTCEKIDQWNNLFLHCRSNLVCESKIDGEYQQRNFTCFRGQNDTLISVRKLNYINDLIQEEFHLDSLYDKFLLGLPGRSIYTNNGYNRYYRRTDKEDEIWELNREARTYFAEKKDTINGFLNSELKKIDTNCNCQYHINVLFKANGKRKIVGRNISHFSLFSHGQDEYFYKLYYAFIDEVEYLKCQRKVLRITKSIDLSHLNIKYEFERSIILRKDGSFSFDFNQYEDVVF